jgi:hypothetical protein
MLDTVSEIVESLVDKDSLAFLMPIDATKSSVDYIYFSAQNPLAYTFTNMPVSFALDNRTNNTINPTHIEIYQLSGFEN